MSHARLSVVALFVVALVAVVCCKKKSTDTAPNSTNLNQLFSDLKSTPQSFSVKAGTDTVLVASNGTAVHFYSNSFQDGKGKIITEGTISLQIVELYSPGDMIANGTITENNDGYPLISGGEVQIVASMNDQEVYANVYGIAFKQKNSSSQTMQLFYGAQGRSDSLISWTMGDTVKKGSVSYGTRNDSSGYAGTWVPPYQDNGFFLIFDSCVHFQWVNADESADGSIVDFGAGIEITVFLPDSSFTNTDTRAYLYYPSIPTVAGNTGYDIGLNAFTFGRYWHCPIGINYKLVVFANKNGSYYYYEHSGVTPNTDLTLTATLSPETRGDIIARLQGL